MSIATTPCCGKCWHTPDTPCPDIAVCLQEGPQCHDDAVCRTAVKERLAAARRDHVERPVIFLGMGTCGLGAGAARTREAVISFLESKKIAADIVETGCVGMCSAEPLMDVQIPGRSRICFKRVTEKNAAAILESVLKGAVPEGSALGQYRGGQAWADVPVLWESSFFRNQPRRVLKNCGIIDPGSMDEYIAHGGYRAMGMMLKNMTPAEVCDVVEQSGLRGRGGGGFLTGRKWKFALNTVSDQKYLICNADEGDPGAFMDRAVIESDPHRLIEGMVAAAYGIGATKAYVYIRAEYPLAIERLIRAIAQAKEAGFLGYNIFDSGFNLDITIKKGAGAFVCGEETALIHSIEGKRGMPRVRPPYPAVRGLFDRPTIINNVETLANLPELMEKGAAWFSSIGTKTSAGTKVFALSGNVRNTGLVEVAMGTKLRDIVFEIGGGIEGDRRFKAVQIGGPSGGCIPEHLLDIDIDYESLKTVGAMMGSGGLVVMDERTCMVDLAKFFMDFIQRESCGKCIPCREGTRRMLETLRRITRGRKSEKDIDALDRFQSVVYMERLAKVIGDTSLCGLGQTASNPVLSTLRYFRDEYEAHVYDRRCPAGVCSELVTYRIDAAACKGCTQCAKKCPSGAIMGARKAPHYIIPDKCIACGACFDVCPFDAVRKE